MLILSLLLALGSTPEIKADYLVPIQGGTTAIGSGIYLSKTLVLTANHVVNDAVVYFVGCGEDSIGATRDYKDDDNDLAILKLSIPCESAVVPKMADKDARMGDRLYAIGCPSGMCGLMTSGIASGYNPSRNRLFSDVQVFFGNSGGPLFNEKGELTGICTGMRSLTHFEASNNRVDIAHMQFSVWVPIKIVKELIKSYATAQLSLQP